MRKRAARWSAPGIGSLCLPPSRSTIFRSAPSVINRSAMPEANAASVSGSRIENFRDELPQLMTSIGAADDTLAEWPNRYRIVNLGEGKRGGVGRGGVRLLTLRGKREEDSKRRSQGHKGVQVSGRSLRERHASRGAPATLNHRVLRSLRVLRAMSPFSTR
jgi:hypothetical protein